MQRYLMTIRYDGTNYHGWQVQPNAVTVQQTVQNSLESALGVRPNITGCSRTDSGVHAYEYCFHFDYDGAIPENKLPLALNTKLPYDISAVDCMKVDNDFHARYSVQSKEYVYKIYNSEFRDPFKCKYSYFYKGNLDVEKMNEAAQNFVGKHDFTSFCASGSSVEDNTRTVMSASVTKSNDMIEFRVRADGFLYNMVRIMAGTLLDVGTGRKTSDNITKIITNKNRGSAGITAPPHGLFLNHVFY